MHMRLLECSAISASLLLAITGTGASGADQASPFEDAVVVWHMAGPEGGTGGEVRLTAKGEAKLGVGLEGPERDASLRRGGNGRVAEFAGGYLVAGEGAEEALHLTGDKMTFCIRLRDSTGKWDTPLFARHAPDDELGKVLHPAPLNRSDVGFPHARRIGEGNSIEFLWRTTPLEQRVHPEYFTQGGWYKFIINFEAKYKPARKGDFDNGVLRLQAPTELIGPDRWHDVVVRFNRAKLEMFVDGVLLDEDWPHGDLHRFTGPFLIGAGYQDGELRSGFHGQIDHAALWDRALSDEEVSELSGGPEEVARRDAEILGPRLRIGQYWRPRGYNTFIGDCMPFSHDGTFHVFFLGDRRHGGGKWGMNALPWGHISTRDFVHWEEHACALDITEPWECCLGTGSFAYHDGKYYLFYIKHDRRAWFKDNPNLGDTIFVATSDDCIHFKKEQDPLFVLDFFNINDINPDIYPNETDGGYLLSVSNWKVWKTNDFKKWEERANLSTPKWWICTSYFKWSDWYYFSSCALLWRSRQPIEDPSTKWNGPPHQTLADGIRVPQIAPFKGRHIMVGFTPEPANASGCGELLIRELIQHPDGTLGTKWVDETIPPSGKPLKLAFESSGGNASAAGNAVNVNAPDGFAFGSLDDIPQNVRITLRVTPKAGTKHFGVCVRGDGDYRSGCELHFDPERQHVRFAPVADGQMSKEPGNWMAVGGVTGIDEPFTLDVIVKDDLVDACIDGRRTIITRNRARLTGDRLFFFVDHGEVTFDEIQVRPLLNQCP